MPEAGAADFTGVRLLSGVDEHVGTEVGYLHKPGPTGFTFVGLFSRVNSSVGLQVGRPIELRSTNVTAIGFLTCVDSLVAGEVAFVAEGGLAAVTFVWFVAMRLQRVPLERGLFGKTAVTFVAEEGPILTTRIGIL